MERNKPNKNRAERNPQPTRQPSPAAQDTEFGRELTKAPSPRARKNPEQEAEARKNRNNPNNPS